MDTHTTRKRFRPTTLEKTDSSPLRSEVSTLAPVFEQEAKSELLKFLKDHPLNIAAAAAAVGISRADAEQIIEKYTSEFVNLEEEYLDSLESAVLLAAAGRPLPDGISASNFKVADAIKVLGVFRKRWKSATKAPTPNRFSPAPNGYAEERLKRLRREAANGERSQILPQTPRRQFQ